MSSRPLAHVALCFALFAVVCASSASASPHHAHSQPHAAPARVSSSVPAAPVRRAGAGSPACSYTNSSGYTFDFSPLQQGADLSGSDGKYGYALHVCGVLSAGSACLTNFPASSACQTAQQSGWVADIGDWTGVAEWTEDAQGNPTYNLTGSKTCWPASGAVTNYQAVVTFVCDSDTSLAVAAPQGGCTIEFIVHTPLACSKALRPPAGAASAPRQHRKPSRDPKLPEQAPLFADA